MHPLVAGTSEALNEFAREFSATPFEWLYESDLQATLFERMRTRLAGRCAKIEAGLLGEPVVYGGSLEVNIGLVKTEYPGGTRFDIAVIDPMRIIKRSPNDASDPFWNQPVRVAVELKYCWVGYKPMDYVQGMRSDIEKIDAWRIRQGPGALDGFSVLFLQQPHSITASLKAKLRELSRSAGGPTHCWAIAPDSVFHSTSKPRRQP